MAGAWTTALAAGATCSRSAEQFSEPFHRVNPQHVLPAFDHDGLLLTRSLPIVEYIDQTWADEPLLPADASGRAQSGQVQRPRRAAIGERRRGRIDV